MIVFANATGRYSTSLKATLRWNFKFDFRQEAVETGLVGGVGHSRCLNESPQTKASDDLQRAAGPETANFQAAKKEGTI